MSTAAQVSDDFKKLQRDARKMKTAGTRGAARHVKNEILDELKGTPFRSRKLRNMGGARLTVSMRVKGDTAVVKAGGPFRLVEAGARPHVIPLRGGNPHRLLKFPDGNVRYGPVKHPGTKGYRPFERGVDKSGPGIVKAFDDALAVSVAKFAG